MSDSHEKRTARIAHDSIKNTNGSDQTRSTEDLAIHTTGLTTTFGDVTAVDDLNLAVEKGEVFGFLGPNGAGKSTTINMLLGFIEPTAGDAEVLGHDVKTASVNVREQIGVLPEGFGLYERLTGRRHLEFAIDWKATDDDVADMLERVGLDATDAARPVGDYSKGMRQRLAFGMALVGDPDLLILDEPSSGLDPHGIRQLRDLVRAEADRGTTVFFSSHILGEVEAICDRVGILYDGELVAVDTVEGLQEAAGVGSQLKLRLADDPPFDIADIGGVNSVSRTDDVLVADCHDPGAKARVVTQVAETGTEILDIGSESASLEDVFTAYTTEQATDRNTTTGDIGARGPGVDR